MHTDYSLKIYKIDIFILETLSLLSSLESTLI